MSDESQGSKWRNLAARASDWTTKAAKVAGTEGMKLAKTAAEKAREEIERQKAAAAERRHAEEEAAAERARREAEARAEEEAIARHMEELRPRVEARWPQHLFPRVPAKVLAIAKAENPHGTFINMREDDLPHLWGAMLAAYPDPPLTDDDRKERERLFWAREARRFTVKLPSGAVGLAPKQKLLDYFATYEKWIFREYFAATGIVMKTFYGEDFIRYALWEPEARKNVPFHKIEVTDNKISHRLFSASLKYRDAFADNWNDENIRFIDKRNDRAEMERDAYFKGLDAHLEKWGEWFFFNVERAFKEAQDAAEPLDPVHGDARPASEAEAQAAASGQAVGRLPIHDQEF